MSKTIDELRAQSERIANATQAGENTATRVGGTITDIVDHIASLEDGNGAVANIAQGAVERDHIANGAVDEHAIMDGAVKTTKIADAAVSASKLAQGAVTSAAMADALKALQWKEIAYSDIDALSEQSPLSTMGAYKVMINKSVYGFLLMTADSAYNQLTQYFITSLILPSDAMAYDYHQQSIYVRTYSRKGNLESAEGTWSVWRKMVSTFNEKLSFSADGRSEDYGMEVGKTIDLTATDVANLKNMIGKGGGQFKGLLNLAGTDAKHLLNALSGEMSQGDMVFFIVSDSRGDYPSTIARESAVNVEAEAARTFFLRDPFGVSVGDFVVGVKIKYLGFSKLFCKVIPVNDAKPASGDFLGADGIESIWDKTQVNKIPAIEATANNALPKVDQLPSLGESNMNNALQSGVYPWCTLGRPTGATGAFTCVVKRTSTADFNGYYSVEQTAYGRESELGQVYKRIIFIKDGEAQYGEWIRIDLGVGSVTSDMLTEGCVNFSSLSKSLFVGTGSGKLEQFGRAKLVGHTKRIIDNGRVSRNYQLCIETPVRLTDLNVKIYRLLPNSHPSCGDHLVRMNKRVWRCPKVPTHGAENITFNSIELFESEHSTEQLYRYGFEVDNIITFIMQFYKYNYDLKLLDHAQRLYDYLDSGEVESRIQHLKDTFSFYWGSRNPSHKCKQVDKSDINKGFKRNFIIALYNPFIGFVPMRVTLHIYRRLNESTGEHTVYYNWLLDNINIPAYSLRWP